MEKRAHPPLSKQHSPTPVPTRQRAAQGTPDAPFTPLALLLQFAFVLLLLLVVVGSAAAIALVVRRSRLSDRLVRFALLPAFVVTLGMVVGFVATFRLMVLALAQAPELLVQYPQTDRRTTMSSCRSQRGKSIPWNPNKSSGNALGTPGNMEIVVAFMGLAVLVAIAALWRGWSAFREQIV